MLFSQSDKLIITEFMAVNNSILTDGDGDYSDWIEIYNPGSDSINLDGWYLTDEILNAVKWKFPPTYLKSKEYLLVFASEKNKTTIAGELHTNFKLSGSGEYLALVEPNGFTISSFGQKYPNQSGNVSYALLNGQYVFMKNPSPGGSNSVHNLTIPPAFSHTRGFYDFSFYLSLKNISDGCEIYYTTNGGQPDKSSGIKYTDAIYVNKTTVISAVAYDTILSRYSEVVSNTYLYIQSILTQPNLPEGYPEVWSSAYPADYEMDPEVCTNENKSQLTNALKSLPSVSLVTSINHLFSFSTNPDSGGIYIHTLETSDEWERPVSMEYIDPVEVIDFQVNCGLRLHGGNSRKPGNSPKHSFRLSFRDKYGLSKLNYNLFDQNTAVNEFNSLVLRAGYNYSWVKNSPDQCESADYIRDPFAKKTQLAMDWPAAHTKFVHVYLNGLYWGVYNISEKITNNFAADYLGGNEDDYDVVKDHFAVTDGNRDAWDSLIARVSTDITDPEKYFKIQGKNADGRLNTSYENLLDAKNLIDYMIINYFIGNNDWDANNWLAARNRITNEHGFQLFCWDAETSMIGLNDNVLARNTAASPSGILKKLIENEAFRLLFAERVTNHFFNNGELTTAEVEKRYMNIANTIQWAMLAESARWGDYRRDVDPAGGSYELYTLDHWLEQVEFMQNTYLKQRSSIVLDQFINAGFYDVLEAPVFSSNGGTFNAPVTLGMTSNAGVIYYTTDKTDPRGSNGAINTGSAILYGQDLHINSNITITARTKLGDYWSPATTASFTINTVGMDMLITNQIIVHGCYPNPAFDFTNFYVNIPNAGNVNLSIYNTNGQQVAELKNGLESKGRHTYTWHTEDLKQGIYVYKFIFSGAVYTGKIVVK